MEHRYDLVLANVQISDGRVADICIYKGQVVHIGAGAPAEKTIDCSGFLVLPAAVDMHVHMRGREQMKKEDWATGSASALAGGVTIVVDQPNTIPPLSTLDSFKKRVQEAKDHSLCSFAINSAVTSETPLEDMWNEGAIAFGETFFAESSYGEAVDTRFLSNALQRINAIGGLATIHAEGILTGNDTGLAAHDTLRSPALEREAILAVQAINTDKCHLHFCHLSSAGSLEVAQGTKEVTPHHLFLSREMTADNNSSYKVNPPIRSEEERKKLWTVWDKIDVVASDHAPHTVTEKELAFSNAPSGIPGTETMVPLFIAELLKKRISLIDIIKKTAITPAIILGITPAGFSIGNRADFAIYPRSITTINPDLLHSKCGWTPFEGHQAVFPRTVVLGGKVAYHERDFFSTDPLWFSGKGYQHSQ